MNIQNIWNRALSKRFLTSDWVFKIENIKMKNILNFKAGCVAYMYKQ